MRLLLDTPVFSVASLWELVIKQALGWPDFRVEPAVLGRALLEAVGRNCRPCIAIPLIGCCWLSCLSGAGAADGRDGLNHGQVDRGDWDRCCGPGCAPARRSGVAWGGLALGAQGHRPPPAGSVRS